MNFYSLNQVVNLCEAVANNHKQIKAFYFGEIFDFNTEQQPYPLMWATVANSTISGKTLDLALQIMILDIVKDDDRNGQDVTSDTLSIIQDVYAMLKDPAFQDNIQVSETVTIEPLYEVFADKCNGWVMNLSIELAYESNRCQVPSFNNPYPSDPICQPAIITLNGNTFLAVPSGTTENIELIDENGDEVTPVSVVGSTITVPNAGGGEVDIVRSDSTLIASVTAPDTYPVNDSDVTLVDSQLNPLRVVTVKADSSINEPIADTIIQLKDSLGANIGSPQNFLAESTDEITAPDSTLTVNSSAFGAPRSNQTVDIDLVNTENVDIPSPTLAYPKITIPDTNYSVVVAGGTPVNFSLPTLKTETINISWT